MNNFSFNKSRSNREEEKENNNHVYRGKHKEIDKSTLESSVFHLGLGNYLCVV